jgi:SET domain-containing protein
MTTRHVCDLAVRPSPIHGKGVFATRKVSPGELMFATTDFAVLPSHTYATVQRSPTEHVLEPRIFRWVNHSCQCNAEARFVDNEIQLLSVGTIQPDEEVLCDYRRTENSIPTPFQCNCGHCEGDVIG